MSWQATERVLRCSESHGASRLVLLALAFHCDADLRNAYPSVKTIMAEARVSRASVFRALDDLQQAGELKTRKKSGQNYYEITVPDVAASPPMRLPDESHGETSESHGETSPSISSPLQGSTAGLLTEPCAAELDPVGVIFERWRTTVPGKTECRLTPGRREKIRARLRTFDVDRLLAAVDQAARDPFLNGANDRGKPFNDFRTIFRNDEKVEELLEDARRGVMPQLRRGVDPEKAARDAERAASLDRLMGVA